MVPRSGVGSVEMMFRNAVSVGAMAWSVPPKICPMVVATFASAERNAPMVGRSA